MRYTKLRNPMPLACAALIALALGPAARKQTTEPRLYTLRLNPGQTVRLSTSANLPVGTGSEGGHWSATFGTISTDGKTYTTPVSVPPEHLDLIEYTGPTSGGIDLRLWVSVVDPTETIADDENALADNPLPQATPHAVDRNSNTLYLTPVLDDYNTGINLFLQAPAGAPPKQRTKKGPHNPPPIGPCGLQATTTVPGDWQDSPPQKSGWKTFGTWKGDVSGQASADIKTLFNVNVSVGFHTEQNVKYMTNTFLRSRFDDVYDCAAGKWKYRKSRFGRQYGVGMWFLPSWIAYFQGYPPNGDPKWQMPYWRDQ